MTDWEGRCVVITAGGPSFSAVSARAIGRARAADAVRVIAVNDTVYPCWFADIAYSCEAKWWAFHDMLPGFAGRKIRLEIPPGPETPGVEVLRSSGDDGYDPRPGFLRHGRNSTYQALHLAVQLGATRIILVGLDMHGQHWFGDHPPPLHRPVTVRQTMIRHFESLARILEGKRVRVVNASPGSRVTAFPIMDLGLAFQTMEIPHGL